MSNNKRTLITFFFSLVFYSSQCQILKDNRNTFPVYEWRQEVCTLGCRATGTEGRLTFNWGMTLQFPLRENLILQPGVQFTAKKYYETGFGPALIFNPAYRISREIHYFSLPVSLRKIVSTNEKGQFFVEGGGMFDFLQKDRLNDQDMEFNSSLSDVGFSFLTGVGLTLLAEDFLHFDLMLRFVGSISKYNKRFSIISRDKLKPYSIGLFTNFRFGLKERS